MKKAIASAVLIAAALSLHATDAVWTNTSTSAQIWTVAANWTNVLDGAALATPPTQATDTVTFPFVDRRRRTVNIYTDSNAAAAGSYTVASVSGPRYWQIQFPGSSYSWNNCQRTFTCADVNGFSGVWLAAGPLQTLALTAESGVQTLETVSARNRLKIDVRNTAAEARVNVVVSPGAIEKNGAGKLTLGAMVHDSQDVYVNKGVLELEGVAVDCSDLFARAVVHLDASRADTMTGYTGDDGRHYVTNWGHASGGTIGAELWDNSADTTASHLKHPHAPFINSNDVASTGLPLMDFGARSAARVDTLGPTNCTLRFTQDLNGVREVFYVDRHSDPASSTGYLLCHRVNNQSIVFSGNDTYTFKYYYNRPALYNGIVTMNGVERFPKLASNNQLEIPRPNDDYSPTWDSMTETGVALAEGISLTHLCCDSLYQGNAGGMRVAEVLIYTNVLTQAERREINTYLMRKWFAAYTCHDVATLHVGSDSTVAVSVPSGRVAHVATALLKSGAKLVKTGDGRLEIDTIEPRNATVEIRGGSVKITPSGDSISTTAPASSPLFWLDAESDGAFEKEGDDIKRWFDCRSEYVDTRRATSVTNGAGWPREVSVEINGVSHSVVEFPTIGSGTGAYMDFPYRKADKSVAYQVEAFIVIRFDNDTYSQLYPIVGMYNSNRNDRGRYNILTPSTCDDGWGGTSATVNGVPLDPFGASNTSDSIWCGGTWYVVSISSNTGGNGLSLRLGGDKAASRCGGVSVAEYIGYDRKLTTEERRNTVAYLMNKWQNAVHPDAQDRGMPAYTFSSDTPVVLSSDGDVTVEACTGGNGIIAKDGVGTVTVDDTISAYTNLAVFAGELAFTKIPFTDKSYMHFDASDTSTFTGTFVDEDASGVKTNVTKWVDVRNPDIYAGKYGGNQTSQCFGTNPVVRVVETRTGQYRQVLDFGNARNRNDSYTYKDCSAVMFDQGHRPSTVVEAYEIFSDAHGYSAAITFGCHSTYTFNRGSGGAWLNSSLSGYFAVDGSDAAYNTNIHDGFHLLTIIPTSPIAMSGLGMTKSNAMSGGFYVGELLIFTSPQTPEERVYLQRSLMHKWFGTAAAEWTNEVDAVTLAAGGRLKVADNNVLVVPSLSGSGTVEAPAVVGIESLALDVVDGLPTCIEVDGDACFAADVMVTFGRGLSRLPAGDYTIFRATGSISGADTANWSVVPAVRNRTFDVVVDGNEVKLRVTASGMFIIVL